MRVRLLHYSHLKGSQGRPGDVVDVDDELGQRWLEGRGCEVVSDDTPLTKQPRVRKAVKAEAQTREDT